ncbi:MAG: ATP-binding protein [Firmicutes bacterium]|nr:ATP-binding protein [Bacillota bacterium]MCL2256168.1 ATP-binding protein [Bacillota bacterium]
MQEFNDKGLDSARAYMIKQKLQNLSNNKDIPLHFTSHDELNKILMEVDEVSEELKNALSQAREKTQELDLILENIDEGILALDNEGKIIACNKMAQDFFCFDYVEPIKVEKVISNAKVLENIKDAQAKKNLMLYDHKRANGEIFQVRFLPVALDKITLIIAMQNVTDLRKVAIEKQEFFANAGHELNTPLSSIVGYSEVLLKDKKYNKTFLETIHREALRMKGLIEDMLRISEIEENKEIVNENIRFDKIIEEVIVGVLPKAKTKKITIEKDVDKSTIFANYEKITEVVSNLVNNAIKYNNENGKVKISLKKNKNNITLTVADNGIGIPLKDQSRIFERFYRVDKARTKTEGGTGLGLSIVKHICNHYNATLELKSTQNQGTTITAVFPNNENTIKKDITN